MWKMMFVAAAIALMVASEPFHAAQASPHDPFGFFAPWVVVSEAERQRLDRDEVIARTLPGRDGQLSIFVATRLNAPPDVLVPWTHAIEALKRSRFVTGIRRFSDPPLSADLADLTLDERDLDDIRECVPGDCGLKLSVPEIESLRSAVLRGGTGWRQAAQEEFRRLLVARVNVYRTGGLAALPSSGDGKTRRRPEQAALAILKNSPYLTRLPDFATWLEGYPRAANPHVASFFYWSKEDYGGGKPVISVTHVGIIRPEPDGQLPAVLVAGKQIFASHYVEGALGLTIVMRNTSNGSPYLVYLNRSQLDVLRGFFGGLSRGVLERRLERQAPEILRGLRARLQSGTAPDKTDTSSPTR